MNEYIVTRPPMMNYIRNSPWTQYRLRDLEHGKHYRARQARAKARNRRKK